MPLSVSLLVRVVQLAQQPSERGSELLSQFVDRTCLSPVTGIRSVLELVECLRKFKRVRRCSHLPSCAKAGFNGVVQDGDVIRLLAHSGVSLNGCFAYCSSVPYMFAIMPRDHKLEPGLPENGLGDLGSKPLSL